MSKIFTYQTRLHLTDEEEAIFERYGELMGQVERTLFAKMCAKKEINALKTEFLKQFQITARQFNSARVQIEGKIESIKKLRIHQIEENKERISLLEKKLAKIKTKDLLHQKKRRLNSLKTKLKHLISDHENGIVRICFGSKKAFRSQFDLPNNGLISKKEWQSQWKKSRNNSFFLMGSKDETSGNQSCVALIVDNGITLRLRLPDALKEHGKYLVLPNIWFKYGQAALLAALQDCKTRSHLLKTKDPHYKEFGQAISYRFKKDKKSWIVYVSISLKKTIQITKDQIGTIGVDINANHLAVVETDRFGNPIKNESIPLNTYGKSSSQTKALIGDAVAKIVNWGLTTQKPIIIEKLDFQKKKSTLREFGFNKYSRMLSSFNYSSIINHIKARSYRFGVKVEEVNPAFTSIIGRVKFATRYGLTIHESAALTIARRFQRVSEKIPRRLDKIPDGKDGHVALSLPARNRDKHVWTAWRMIHKNSLAALAAHFRAKRSKSRYPPTSL
jgi:IS605 OrfB family transposase